MRWGENSFFYIFEDIEAIFVDDDDDKSIVTDKHKKWLKLTLAKARRRRRRQQKGLDFLWLCALFCLS